MRTSQPKWVVLSPHLDDGILSCGGLMAALSPHYRVEVWTVFGGAPWRGPYSGTADWLHGACGGRTGSRLARMRRKEDRSACRLLGLHWRHFRWHDAVYRRGCNREFIYQNCCRDSWKGDDEPIICELIHTLGKCLGGEDRVLVPMAIGRHVDHLIVRHAAEQTNHPGLIYYPDIPYLQRFPGGTRLMPAGMEVLHYGVSDALVARWVHAVQAYRSQMRMLEEAFGPLDALITGYAAARQTALFGSGNGSLALESAAGDLQSVGLGVA